MLWIYILLGTVPSLIWLSIYLREDEHPEPLRLLVRTFFVGALAAFIAALVQFVLVDILQHEVLQFLPLILIQALIFFGAVAFVEEYAKYLAVHLGIEWNSAFDEPTDAMIYLIVAALGFAAVENVLTLTLFQENIVGALEVLTLRFLSATLLHALASAIVGYYLARQHFHGQHGIAWHGILIATAAHGLYNVLVLASEGFTNVFVTTLIVILLAILAITVNHLFYRLKKTTL